MGKPEEKEGREETKPKPRIKSKQKESESGMKYYLFLGLIIFPSLAWLIGSAADTFANLQNVFGRLTIASILPVLLVLPVILCFVVKGLRSLLKFYLPLLLAILIFPTMQVYFCSPVPIENKDIGTQFSLKTTADEFLQQSCVNFCLKKSRIPSAYALTFFKPRVAIKLENKQLINLNVSSTAMIGGEERKLATIILLQSLRSVKGKVYGLNILAKVPVKMEKKFQEGIVSKSDFVLTGRIQNVPSDLGRLKSQLERQRHFVRPFSLDVFRLEVLEVEKEGESKD